MVLDLLHAEHVLKDADLVITGEGKMDNQTLQGKAPFGIAQRAKMAGIPVIGLAGSLGSRLTHLMNIWMRCLAQFVRLRN
ncbi:glycerate kinase [Mangrovibacter sp. SLW1]